MAATPRERWLADQAVKPAVQRALGPRAGCQDFHCCGRYHREFRCRSGPLAAPSAPSSMAGSDSVETHSVSTATEPSALPREEQGRALTASHCSPRPVFRSGSAKALTAVNRHGTRSCSGESAWPLNCRESPPRLAGKQTHPCRCLPPSCALPARSNRKPPETAQVGCPCFGQNPSDSESQRRLVRDSPQMRAPRRRHGGCRCGSERRHENVRARRATKAAPPPNPSHY